MTAEFDVVDEVARETAEYLRDTDAIIAWKAEGDGALILEPTE